MSAMSEEWDRKRAELAAHYARIEQMWTASGMPVWVRDTPSWQDGWRVLLGWLAAHGWPDVDVDKPLVHANGWPVAGSSYWSGHWPNELHIFSHVLSPVRGHHATHAALEEEGVRLILQWWSDRELTEALRAASLLTLAEGHPLGRHPCPLLTGTGPAGNGRAHRAYYQGFRIVDETLTGQLPLKAPYE